MTTFFVDLSHHDWNRRGGNLDWPAVLRATSPVVVIRATYGDPSGWNRPTYHFAEMQQGAQRAGFDARGGYHNLIRGDGASIARQVDWLRRELDAADCVWGMADIEPYEELRAAGMWPRWEDVLRWRDRWAAVEDRVMAWYIGTWVWRDWLGQPDLRGLPGPLINARYPISDGTPQQIYPTIGGDAGAGWGAYGGRVPDVWQFTATGDVAGASVNTDCNAHRGTVAQLKARLGSVITVEETEMGMLARTKDNPAVWYGNGFVRRGVASMAVVDALVAGGARWLNPFSSEAEMFAAIGPRLDVDTVTQTEALKAALATLGRLETAVAELRVGGVDLAQLAEHVAVAMRQVMTAARFAVD